MYNYNIVVCN